MSRTDILSEIKKAEADAAVTVEQAEADRKAVIANARRDSVSKIQAAEADMREASEAEISAKKDELAAERGKLLSTGTAEAEKLEKKAAGKMPKVREFLNKEVERTLNAAS